MFALACVLVSEGSWVERHSKGAWGTGSLSHCEVGAIHKVPRWHNIVLPNLFVTWFCSRLMANWWVNFSSTITLVVCCQFYAPAFTWVSSYWHYYSSHHVHCASCRHVQPSRQWHWQCRHQRLGQLSHMCKQWWLLSARLKARLEAKSSLQL